MSNRDRGRSGSAFNMARPEPVSPEEITASIYTPNADLAAVDATKQTARPISIFDVRPDPRQPRREFPHSVAPRDYTPDAIVKAFESWIALADAESGRAFVMRPYFEMPEGWERPENPGPIEHRLMRLVGLAADIYHIGKLIEPIQVSREGAQYRIIHGERRWLAHWLLYMFTGDGTFTQILAHVAPKHSVWQQASENGVRSDLNAVGKARQLALLIMDLYQASHQFVDMVDMVPPGDCDRPFYAQVADADVFRVPHGWAERIARVTGLSPNQQRQYRAILRASDALWIEADDHDLTEREIRGRMAELRKSVTAVTESGLPLRPFVVKVAAQTAPRWEQVKATLPGVPDSQIVDHLVDFYLNHKAEEQE